MTEPFARLPLRVPMSMSRRAFVAGISAIALTAGVARAQDDGARTIEHPLGSTVVPAAPQRVLIGSDFTDLEYTLALGIKPVAFGFTGAWARGALPWQVDAGIDDIASFEMADGQLTPEIVIGYDPDLILSMKYIVESAIDQLDGIAPVVTLDWNMTWRDGLRTAAKALFVEDKAEELIAETEALIAETATRLNGLGGKKIMIGSKYGETLYVIGAGPIADLFAELGLTFVPAPNPGDSGLAEYSMENVDVLADADILLSFATDTEATAMLEDFLPFQRLKAVAGRAYGPLDPVTGSAISDNFSPLSAVWVLPRFADLLEQLARGEGKAI